MSTGDKLVLGEGVEKHPERSIGLGELQVDYSVKDILVRRTQEPPKLVREAISIRPFWLQWN